MKEIPVKGKTYSLFGDSDSTEGYFRVLDELLDELIPEIGFSEYLLDFIQRRNSLSRFSIRYKASTQQEFFHRIKSKLDIFVPKLSDHLKGLSYWNKINDHKLGFREDQYYFSMLEIALLNRLNKQKFLKTNYRIALLPHCLKDLNANCKSKYDGFDMICRNCSKECFINHVSGILKQHQVMPYIWMRSNFKKLGKKLKNENKTLGIVGIACIPELINGMRKCQKYKIPVLGLPLNANRCARWFDEFHNNSVNLRQLDNLILRND